MGINARYYVISIASIFISLGLGIFIGFNMNGQELYLNQYESLVNSLENKFIEYQKQNENLQEKIKNLNIKNEKQSIFVENAFLELIHNKLPNLNVAIIETTNDYSYSDIEKTLITSGAYVPLKIKYEEKVFNTTKEDLKSISNLTGIEVSQDTDLINLINKEILNFIIYKDTTDILQLLIDNQYVVFNLNYDSIDQLNINDIIIAGGSKENKREKIQNLNINLAEILKEEGLNVTGVEKNNVEISYISELKRINISTIDNIDTLIGKISLVYILKGAYGHYGEKPSAEFLSPLVIKDFR